MNVLDFVQMHNLCARVADEGLDPLTIFGPVDSHGFRQSIFGGYISDQKHEAFLIQCRLTIQAVGVKRQIVAYEAAKRRGA